MAIDSRILAQRAIVHGSLPASFYPLSRMLPNLTHFKAKLFGRNNSTLSFRQSFTSWIASSSPKSATAALANNALSVDTEIDQTSEIESGQAEKFTWKSNWFAVHSIGELDPSRPHNVWVLGRPYVLWKDASGVWRSFLDRCPHRLVPLSEGRISETGQLQCSYHGWSFQGDGKCTSIPQAATTGPESRLPTSARACATPVPLVEAKGLLFLWPDENGWEKAKSTPLPILEVFDRPDIRSSGFTRDMAFGWEYLAENVVDISHLPFAHHGLGPLKRENAKPLPLHVTSQSALGFVGEMTDDVFPTEHTAVSFRPTCFSYDRYLKEDKRSVTSIYITPTRPGHSRILVFSGTNSSKKSPIPQWMLHNTLNAVNDGDSFHLHAQERMQRMDGWSSKDWARAYFSPTSADRFVIALRQWLTGHAGGEVEWAKGVNPTLPVEWASRESVMDRYNSHTKHCKMCSEALNNFEKGQVVAMAISLVLIVVTAALRGPFHERATVGLLAIASAGAAYWLQSQVKIFKYVGYDHAARK